ncbi:glycosyltransferase family 1 protein [Pedobacter sp. HMWF019]|nr:glycosyltransferase family 1 protein [Pedobacter sp. HMWF019]
MKVSIIGTRGIPNHYGGFEQCAEYLALGLVKRGFEVIVYNSHSHPYQEKEWKGVKIVHCYDPEDKLGTAGQFIYDLNCILNVRKQNCDVVLQLGYTSSSVWGWLLPQKSVVTTNMDGLEWKRTKYSQKVRKFLQYAERLGVKYSDHLISDSIGIQEYLKTKYKKDSTFIAYGATLFENPDVSDLKEYGLVPQQYDMLIARLEPENSIEIILDGVQKAGLERPFLVVGKHETVYGEYLKQKFASYSQIRFIGGIYNINTLNNLRYYSNVYFHGHTVGGTNPSLLEAMASSSLICANDNPFNKYILENDAFYFQNAEEVAGHLLKIEYVSDQCQIMLKRNRDKITNVYDWELIADQYAAHLSGVKGKFNR